MGGKLKKKGKAGAAKNYITRTQALKKLQCSLADFRRLCILKGIFPREPRHKKRANKSATSTTTFYYFKDIQYLLHEPVLAKLREHKAFAKKLTRALVRTQWGLAKNLDETKPTYRLDHIIKERYPTFVDSLRDLDDALSLIILFANLPASEKVTSTVIGKCGRLAAEWQLYVMRSRSLRKVFLSIKGIYFQAEVHGQSITWLVPYQFTPNVPADIDFRIMLTFLELYQTLLGFVFYKLFTDINLIYPPKFDESRDSEGAGLGALLLEETSQRLTVDLPADEATAPSKRLTTKDVKRQIRDIASHAQDDVDEDVPMLDSGAEVSEVNRDTDLVVAGLPTSTNEVEERTKLFEPYYFFLSREVTRPTLEFCIRSFGGSIGWDPILGGGSPFPESDPRITHHIVDRPLPTDPSQVPQYPGKRVTVQPQWVVDCINAGYLLPTGPYAPGQLLPPHLSPFVNEDELRAQGGYIPQDAEVDDEESVSDDVSEVEEEEEAGVDETEEWTGIAGTLESDPSDDEEPIAEVSTNGKPSALQLAAQDPTNEALVHEAELEAEALGIPYSQFESNLAQATKEARKTSKSAKAKPTGEPSTSVLLTGKKRNLYQQMSRQKAQKEAEREQLLAKKKAHNKAQRRKASEKNQ